MRVFCGFSSFVVVMVAVVAVAVATVVIVTGCKKSEQNENLVDQYFGNMIWSESITVNTEA